MSATTDLVPSVSIANLVNQRAAVLARLRSAVELVREASEIAAAGHLGMPRIMVSNTYGRHASDGRNIATAYLRTDRDGARWTDEASPAADIDEMLTKGIDAAAWQYLMHESGLRSLMDATARQKWDGAINDGKIPELTDANIRSTFAMLHDQRGDMFERGVVACFKALSWSHTTNLPQKFGKRAILRFVRGQVAPVRRGSSGTRLGSPNYNRCSSLDDLERVFHVLDGKPEPDHRQGWYGRIGAARSVNDPDPESDYLRVSTFRNGNGHLTFKRLDLVDKMNRIIAKHYPGALPAPKGAA